MKHLYILVLTTVVMFTSCFAQQPDNARQEQMEPDLLKIPRKYQEMVEDIRAQGKGWREQKAAERYKSPQQQRNAEGNAKNWMDEVQETPAYKSNLVDLGQSNGERLFRSSKYILVMFYDPSLYITVNASKICWKTQWTECSHSMRMMPQYELAAMTLRGQVVTARCDITAETGYQKRFKILDIPEFLLFKCVIAVDLIAFVVNHS